MAANHKLLLPGQLDFDPRTASPTGLVRRVRSFGDQAFELELARYLKKLFSCATEHLRKADIRWSFLKQPGQLLTPFDKRPRAQIGSVQEEQIEGVIDKRGLFGLPVGLKELEGRPPLIVKGGDLAVDRRLFGSQRFQGIDKLGVIVVEIRSVP